MGTEEELSGDEALTDPLQGMANCLDSMMSMILELSQKVHGPDKAAVEQLGFPLTSASGPQLGQKKARHQYSHAVDLKLDEMVCQRVEQRLSQVPMEEETTCQEDSRVRRSRSHGRIERPSSQA